MFEKIFVRFGSSGESANFEIKSSFLETLDWEGIILTKSSASFDYIIKAENGLTKMSAMKYKLSRRPPQSPSQSNKLSVLRRILCKSGFIYIDVLKNLYLVGKFFQLLSKTLKSFKLF